MVELEKETSESIDFINYESMNWSKKRQDEHWNKVWVNQESLIEKLEIFMSTLEHELKEDDILCVEFNKILEELKGKR